MVNIKAAEFLIKCVSFVIAYAWVITLPNVVQSYVARWAGDDTPTAFGFNSFNPLQHVDIFGLVVLVISCGFGSPLGWGRNVYLDPFNIQSRWKLLLVSFADVITHIIITFFLLIVLEVIFGLSVLGLFQYMVLGRDVSHLLLARFFPDANSLSVVIGFIIFVAIYLHLLLAILYAILNSRDFYLVCKASSSMDYAVNRIKPSNFFIPLILLFVFAEPLRLFIVYLIMYAGLFVGRLLGL